MVDALDNMRVTMASLLFVVLLFGALALALAGFQDGMDDNTKCALDDSTWNETQSNCVNSTNDVTGTSISFNISREGLRGVDNASSYFDTIGTLIAVGALIAIVVGAFMFVRN